MCGSDDGSVCAVCMYVCMYDIDFHPQQRQHNEEVDAATDYLFHTTVPDTAAVLMETVFRCQADTVNVADLMHRCVIYYKYGHYWADVCVGVMTAVCVFSFFSF